MIILPFSRIVESESETEEIAAGFSEMISEGDLVLLNGDLGSGKTFFVKCLCSNYGIQNVTSPSFAIVNEYSGLKKIFHFDFYRIKKLNELYDIGIEDYLKDDKAIALIEWAELWNEIIPNKHYEVRIEMFNEQKRKISITKQ
ncbi:MAG TPA: tRNA (adenosine(37)-N6)-threonylcarbamoyltransferase complex ATPase subunit type 1 TsaE [Melioribacteraceae bacterium]|nr:tRNA (adenosine(37)-N6)-threonylcarbamoyltransferase complex ATPase subunit type 1 TsaE [Melioribacteraceae bacterium]